MKKPRESWGSRFALVMAVAGSAIGLGNFLRFPAKAAANGGGAFMIPYLVSLLLLGIPLMLVEWTLGRYGGGFGHGTAPGIFHSINAKNRFIKYFGITGIFGPLVIFSYYIFIESWTLAFSFFSLAGRFRGISDQQTMKAFLQAFQGVAPAENLPGLGAAYLFFLATFAANVLVVAFGIRHGIERLCRMSMPLLFLCAFVLMLRVLTMRPAVDPEWTVSRGFGFLWNPDFAALKSARVWLEAAGQIFFSLSVGIGIILTYASYISKDEDVVLSGLTAVGANEFAEVILGGSIIIPAAFVFMGPANMKTAAGSGFDLGFITMPMILHQLPFGRFFGFLWFFLLFLAGITSSVSLAQPCMAFLEDEFDISRNKAALFFGTVAFALAQPPIFLLSRGVLDEMDFWGGTFFLVVFAAIETVLFAWGFGMNNAWDEIHRGAALRLPGFYRFVIKYVTPLFLFVILAMWVKQDWLDVMLMRKIAPADKPFILGVRLGLAALLGVLALAVRQAWRRRRPKSGGLNA